MWRAQRVVCWALADRADTGFPDRVYFAVETATSQQVLLSMHSAYVLTLLISGNTIREALNLADPRYRPQTSPDGITFVGMDMVLGTGSDPYRRLFNVYAENDQKRTL